MIYKHTNRGSKWGFFTKNALSPKCGMSGGFQIRQQSSRATVSEHPFRESKQRRQWACGGADLRAVPIWPRVARFQTRSPERGSSSQGPTRNEPEDAGAVEQGLGCAVCAPHRSEFVAMSDAPGADPSPRDGSAQCSGAKCQWLGASPAVLSRAHTGQGVVLRLCLGPRHLPRDKGSKPGIPPA